MIKIEKTAKTLEEGIKNLMSGAKQDYVRMSTNNGKKELTGYSLEQTNKWDSNTRIFNGKNILKLYKKMAYFVLL